MRKSIVSLIIGASLFSASVASAQTASYWCGSYWSNQPCGYNSGYYQYPTNQYPSYQYQQYQYNPYQYNNSYGYYPYTNSYYYYPQPSCSITYSYTNNPSYSNGVYNQAIQLTWSSSYSTSAYISGVGNVSPSGTRVVYPYGYTQYVMTVSGPGGSNNCYTYFQAPQYYPQQWNQYMYPGYWTY